MPSVIASRSDPRTLPWSSAACDAAAVRRHYDSLALLYRLFWGSHLHHGLFLTGRESPAQAQLVLVRHLLALLPGPPPRRVLDVGCGYGATSVYLARKFHCDVMAISLSPRQVQFAARLAAREDIAHRVNFLIGDAEELSCPAAAFDLLWIVEASEHFTDKVRFFRNAAHALPPGGSLLLAAWTAAPNLGADRHQQIASAAVSPGLATADEYVAMLHAAGLTVTAREDLTVGVLPTWTLVRRRVSLARKVAPMFSRAARQFADAVDVIAAAFANRELLYHVFAAQRQL